MSLNKIKIIIIITAIIIIYSIIEFLIKNWVGIDTLASFQVLVELLGIFWKRSLVLSIMLFSHNGLGNEIWL